MRSGKAASLISRNDLQSLNVEVGVHASFLVGNNVTARKPLDPPTAGPDDTMLGNKVSQKKNK